MPVPIIVQALFAKGLDLMANAVLAKGQDVIEKELGIKIPANPTQEDVETLRGIEIAHEQFLTNAALNAEAKGQEQVTDRWKADMTSDSWLSKTIRPMVLAYWTVVISVMAFASDWLRVDSAFVELIKISYGIILTAYFVGRGIEKVSAMGKGKI